MTKKVEDADPEIETKKTEERDIVGSDGDVKTCPEAGTEKKSLSDDVEVIKSSKEDTDDDLPVPDKYLVKNWVTLASGLRIRIDEERSSGSEPVVTGIYFEGGPETGIESIWDSWKPESADGQSFVVLSPNIDSHRVYLENPWFRQRGGAGANRISKRGSDSHQPVNVTFSIPGGQPRNQQKKPGFPGPDYISTILSGMRPVSPGMRKQQPYAPMRPQASQYQMPTLQRPTSAPRINVGGPMYNLLPRMPMVNQNAMNCCAQYNAFQQPYGQSPLMCYGPPLYPPLRTTGGGMQLPNRNHFSSQSYRNISDEEIAAVAAAAMSGDGGKHPQVIEIIRDPNDEGSPDDCVVIELENEEECNSFNRKKRNSPVIHVRGGSRQNKSQQSAEKKAPIIIVTGNNPQYPGVTASGGGLKSPLVIVPDKQKGNIMTSTGDNRVLYETRHCGQRVYGGEDMSAGEHEACDSSTDDNYVEPVAYARPCSAAPPRNQQGGACSPGQYLSPSAPGQNPYYTERRPRTSAEPQRRAAPSFCKSSKCRTFTTPIHGTTSSPVCGLHIQSLGNRKGRVFGPRFSAESISKHGCSPQRPSSTVKQFSRPLASVSTENGSSSDFTPKTIYVNPVGGQSSVVQYSVSRYEDEETMNMPSSSPSMVMKKHSPHICIPYDISSVPIRSIDASSVSQRYAVKVRSGHQLEERSLLVQPMLLNEACDNAQETGVDGNDHLRGSDQFYETRHLDSPFQSSTTSMCDACSAQVQKSQSEMSMLSQSKVRPCVSVSSEPDVNSRKGSYPPKIPEKMKRKLLKSLSKHCVSSTVPVKSSSSEKHIKTTKCRESLSSSDLCEQMSQERSNHSCKSGRSPKRCPSSGGCDAEQDMRYVPKTTSPKESLSNEFREGIECKEKKQSMPAIGSAPERSVDTALNRDPNWIPPPMKVITSRKKVPREKMIFRSPIPQVNLSNEISEHAKARILRLSAAGGVSSVDNIPSDSCARIPYMPAEEHVYPRIHNVTPFQRLSPREEYFSSSGLTDSRRDSMPRRRRLSHYSPPPQHNTRDTDNEFYTSGRNYPPAQLDFSGRQRATAQETHDTEGQYPQTQEEIDNFIAGMVRDIKKRQNSPPPSCELQRTPPHQRPFTESVAEADEMIKAMNMVQEHNERENRINTYHRYMNLLKELGASSQYQTFYVNKLAGMTPDEQKRELAGREKQLNEMTEEEKRDMAYRIRRVEKLRSGQQRIDSGEAPSYQLPQNLKRNELGFPTKFTERDRRQKIRGQYLTEEEQLEMAIELSLMSPRRLRKWEESHGVSELEADKNEKHRHVTKLMDEDVISCNGTPDGSEDYENEGNMAQNTTDNCMQGQSGSSQKQLKNLQQQECLQQQQLEIQKLQQQHKVLLEQQQQLRQQLQQQQLVKQQEQQQQEELKRQQQLEDIERQQHQEELKRQQHQEELKRQQQHLDHQEKKKQQIQLQFQQRTESKANEKRGNTDRSNFNLRHVKEHDVKAAKRPNRVPTVGQLERPQLLAPKHQQMVQLDPPKVGQIESKQQIKPALTKRKTNKPLHLPLKLNIKPQDMENTREEKGSYTSRGPSFYSTAQPLQNALREVCEKREMWEAGEQQFENTEKIPKARSKSRQRDQNTLVMEQSQESEAAKQQHLKDDHKKNRQCSSPISIRGHRETQTPKMHLFHETLYVNKIPKSLEDLNDSVRDEVVSITSEPFEPSSEPYEDDFSETQSPVIVRRNTRRSIEPQIPEVKTVKLNRKPTSKFNPSGCQDAYRQCMANVKKMAERFH